MEGLEGRIRQGELGREGLKGSSQQPKMGRGSPGRLQFRG
jgi:hypothetical protein